MIVFEGGVLNKVNHTFSGFVTVVVDDADSTRLFDLLAEIMQRAVAQDDALIVCTKWSNDDKGQ